MSDEAGHGEQLIIKRGGGGHHDEHHGGVWKIAFADFMTAMMAFFLVMWLISANDKTKATIARYFNPMELVDSTPQPQGLQDSKKDDPNVPRKADKATPEQPGKDKDNKDTEARQSEKAAPAPGGAVPRPLDEAPIDDALQSAKHDEVEVIRDPYAVIAEVATKMDVTPPKQAAPDEGERPMAGDGAIGRKGGQAFRDPFQPQPPSATLADPFAAPDVPLPPAPPPGRAAPAAAGAHAAEAPSPAATPPDPAAAKAADAVPEVAAAPDRPLPPAALAARISSQITALARAPGPDGTAQAGPRIEVRQTPEGVLVSLTDTADFTMFPSASARPSPRAVTLVGQLGRLLKNQKGTVTVRGYTDSRPFRSDTYDNWRLSTERAHIAQYMLVRGGLDDSRIDAVEGFADRHPKNPKNPEGPENRRIEVLIRNATP